MLRRIAASLERRQISSTAAGPYVKAYANPQPSNTAPAYYKGAFYVTDQGTTSLLTATSLAGPWTTFSAITRPSLPYTVEDPFLYFDSRGNIHVINHAYNTAQTANCTSSWVSSHFFAAADGKRWGHSDQPYGHTVQFDDGSEHSYCTLERPNLFFGADGTLTHIHFAADLVTQDEGCASRGKGGLLFFGGREGDRRASLLGRITLTVPPPVFFSFFSACFRLRRLQVCGPRGHAAREARCELKAAFGKKKKMQFCPLQPCELGHMRAGRHSDRQRVARALGAHLCAP